MSPVESYWAVIAAAVAAVLAPGGIGFWVLSRRSRIGAEAAEKVAGEGPKPVDYDQALIVLADRVEKQNNQLLSLRLYLADVLGWGHRGWAHVAAERREDVPKPPDSLAL